jgi:hypothetical protein
MQMSNFGLLQFGKKAPEIKTLSTKTIKRCLIPE